MSEAIRENKLEYSSDEDVNWLTEKVVTAVKRAGSEEPNFGELQVEKLRGKVEAMKAHSGNEAIRLRPGSSLKTYTGVRNPDGTLKDETNDGKQTIGENTTIYRKQDALRYSESNSDPSLRGFPIKGHFEDDGTFVEDMMGPETLYNEYATDNPEHPKKKYGIDPQPGVWTEGLAQIPSYLIRVPEGKQEVTVNTAGGKKISVKGGDFVVVDALGEGKVSVQAIEKNMKESTYAQWE